MFLVRLFKKLFASIALILLLVMLAATALRLGVPSYRFPATTPFAGDSIYNPYRGIDSSAWIKANYHAHQLEKPRCDYSAEEFIAAYKAQDYNVIGLSDHQKINPAYTDRPGYIPTYEHGWNINRFHQLVLGAQRVDWRDIPLFITPSDMQYMFNRIAPQAELMVLNHPGTSRVWSTDVYQKLRGYDLLELNPERHPERISTLCWDKALSAGIHANLISDDDAHSITNRSSFFQRSFTRLNTPSLSVEDQLHNLHRGAAYGVFVGGLRNQAPNPHANVPEITEIGLRGDTIYIGTDRPATEVRFIGQGGTTLQSSAGSDSTTYIITAEDTYVRAELYFGEHYELFTNPFVRTLEGTITEPEAPTIDYPITILLHLLYVVLMLLLVRAIVGVWRAIFRRRPRRGSRYGYYDNYR